MMVERRDSGRFEASPEQLRGSILGILKRGQRGYSYVDTEVDGDSGDIHTRVRPSLWPFLLSTRLDIQIEGDDSASSVVVRTRSQWFLFGDVFDFYNGYIRDLLSSLRSEMKVAQGAGA